MSAVMASWIEVPGWSMRYCLITAGSGISPSGISVGMPRNKKYDDANRHTAMRIVVSISVKFPLIMASRIDTTMRTYPLY